MTTHEFLTNLGRHVRAEQDAQQSGDELVLVREKFLSRVDDILALRESRAMGLASWYGRLRAPLLLAAAAGVLLLAGMAWRLLGHGEEPLAFAIDGRDEAKVGDWLAASVDESLLLRFSDGSRFELAPSARGRVLEVDARGSHVMLERGAAKVQVTKRPDSHWRFSVGPFVVEVLGTTFDLAWDPEQDEFVLRLTEGRVNVSGCSFREGRPVLPGETVRASCAGKRFEVTTHTDEDEQLAAGDEEDVQTPEVASPTVRSPSRAPRVSQDEGKISGWREAAKMGRYAEAISLAEAEGFGSVLNEANAVDLSLLADAARLAGRTERALSAYQAVRRRFGGTMAASTAAFHLARIHFDQLGAYSRAASWFETYLTEQPRGGLAREATGRWLESLQRSGNHAGARKVAERYLAQFPQGPHAPMARSLLRP